MIINCYIIEDEEPAAELLTMYVDQHENLNLKGIFYNNINLPDEVTGGTNLIFLDIQMPFRSGIAFLKDQKKIQNIPVILTTSQSQYAIDAFDLSVIDYLVKPYSISRFNEAINKAISYFKLNEALKKENDSKFIQIKHDYQTVKIIEHDILYIEGMKQYLKIITKNKNYIILDSFKNMEQQLPNSFLRVHKSYLVNKNHIQKYSRTSLIINNIEISIGKKFNIKLLE